MVARSLRPDPGPDGTQSARRVLFYSHDTFGLGHLRRVLSIAGELAAQPSPPAMLIATGARRADQFPVPRGTDYLRLPAIVKRSDGTYGPGGLSVGLDEMLEFRSKMLVAALKSFRPDVIVVDHAPVGVEGELWPMFQALADLPYRPRLVLGLRDIIDDAARVRDEWNRLGVWNALDGVYDHIVVYGDRRVPTTADELQLPVRLPAKVEFTGYLGHPRLSMRLAGGTGPVPSLLITAGGGGDGAALIETFARFAETAEPDSFHATVVTGPFFPGPDRKLLRQRLAGCPVEVLEIVNGLDALLACADGVVAMAGYNTVTEILSARVPALLFPRSAPRREQLIRAQRLSRLGHVSTFDPGKDPVLQLRDFVDRLHGRQPAHTPVRLDGLSRTAALICSLFAEAELSDALRVRAR